MNAVEPKLVGVPKGTPGSNKGVIPEKTYSNELSLKLWPDFKYRDVQETMKDTWQEFVKRGWLTAEGKPALKV